MTGTSSVRLRITLWNVAALAALLVLFGLGFRWALGELLIHSLDEEMRGQVAALSNRWESVPAPRRQALLFFLRMRPGILADQVGDIGNSAALLLGGAAPEGVPVYPWQLLDAKGKDYLKGTKVEVWDTDAYKKSLRGEICHTTRHLPSGDTVRICSYPIHKDKNTIEAVAQTVRSLEPTERVLHSTDQLLLFFLPVALLVSGIAGILLTGQALVPVGRLSATVTRISAADLSERLPMQGGDEFARLATVINEMLARLEQAFEQQRRFTADASHELRSPLTVILGQSSLALNSPQTDENRESWERATRAARRMERLVTDLLMLARSDARQLELESKPLHLRDILEAAVEAIPTAQRQEGASLQIVCPEDLWVKGDSAHLERAIHNLLTNALRHTPATGAITMTAIADGERKVRLTVTDTGSGIPVEHIAHLFERFYRVDKGRSQNQGGAGLGLAITRSIVAAQGGDIEIQSTVGDGTTVLLILPEAIPEPNTTSPS